MSCLLILPLPIYLLGKCCFLQLLYIYFLIWLKEFLVKVRKGIYFCSGINQERKPVKNWPAKQDLLFISSNWKHVACIRLLLLQSIITNKYRAAMIIECHDSCALTFCLSKQKWCQSMSIIYRGFVRGVQGVIDPSIFEKAQLHPIN